MRLIADEMVSPKIVRIISESVLRSGWVFDSIIGNREKYRGKADEDWIAAFARSGGQGLLSADRKMLRRESMLQRISETGVVGIYMPSQWAEARRADQIAHISHWWTKIEAQFEAASAGTAWVVPRGLGNAELRQHPISKKLARNDQEEAS